MPGIRLHHDTLHDCTVAVECARGYPEPYACPLCGLSHDYKTVHLVLDAKGDVIVSKEVWKDLKDVPGLPFTYANDVKKPPARTLAVGGEPEPPGELQIVHHSFKGRR